VRKFVVAESVEEKMVKLQDKKKDIATEILNDNGTGVSSYNNKTNPTLEDFKELFKR
jgi:SNF2 family DNA or RNA helicase